MTNKVMGVGVKKTNNRSPGPRAAKAAANRLQQRNGKTGQKRHENGGKKKKRKDKLK